MSISSFFTKKFNSIDQSIEFKKEWSDGVGHFDRAVYGEHAPKLVYGQMVKSMSPGGRRLIFIGTRLGNVIVYDRFIQEEIIKKKHDPVFYIDTTAVIRESGWFSQKYLDEYEMEIALGGQSPDEGNIGWRIEQLHAALKKAA